MRDQACNSLYFPLLAAHTYLGGAEQHVVVDQSSLLAEPPVTPEQEAVSRLAVPIATVSLIRVHREYGVSFPLIEADIHFIEPPCQYSPVAF